MKLLSRLAAGLLLASTAISFALADTPMPTLRRSAADAKPEAGVTAGGHGPSITADATGSMTGGSRNVSSDGGNVVRSFADHAALVAAAPLALSAGITTLTQTGFYMPGDGGEAAFDWTPTSTASPTFTYNDAIVNDPTVILPAGQTAGMAGRFLLRAPDSTINVRAVGAKGQALASPSTADDSVAFQAAINALPNGGTVYVPTGQYAVCRITDTNSGVTIRGAGRGARPLSGTVVGPAVLYLTNTSGNNCTEASMLKFGSATAYTVGSGLKGISINAQAQTGTNPTIFVRRVNMFVFDDVTVDGGVNGLLMYGTQNVKLLHYLHQGYSGTALEWYGDAVNPSNVLVMQDVDLAGTTGSDGKPNSTGRAFYWHDNAVTVDADTLRINQANAGIFMDSTIAGAGASTSPRFGTFHNLQIDYTLGTQVEMHGASDMKFDQSYFNTSYTSVLFAIFGTDRYGPSNLIKITNSGLSGASNSAIVSASAYDVQISGTSIRDWNRGALNESGRREPAIDVIKGPGQLLVTGNAIGRYAGKGTAGSGAGTPAIRLNGPASGGACLLAANNTYFDTTGVVNSGSNACLINVNNIGP